MILPYIFVIVKSDPLQPALWYFILLLLIFKPEDGGEIFLRYIGWF
jgi:hypothetical protein